MSAVNYIANEERYSTGMKYRRAGKSGILLPEISLGFWKNFGYEVNFKNSLDLVHYAFDQGIIHFDLANNYGPPYGAAEATFGKIMRESMHHYREELFISTKAGYDMWPGPYGNWGSRKSLLTSLDKSLQRMNLDYVDLFYSHRYDPLTPIEETLQALVDSVKQGKALYVGISRWPLEAMKKAVVYLKERDVPCLAYQGRLNLLDRGVEKEGILEFLQKEKIGFTSFSPLAQGLLTDKYLGNKIPRNSRMALGESLKKEILTPLLLEKLKGLNLIAMERGESLAQLALKWVLRRQVVNTVIVGVSSIEQLDNNIGCLSNEELSLKELDQIEDILTEN